MPFPPQDVRGVPLAPGQQLLVLFATVAQTGDDRVRITLPDGHSMVVAPSTGVERINDGTILANSVHDLITQMIAAEIDTILTRVNSGPDLTARPRLNFIDAPGFIWTIVDSGPQNEIQISLGTGVPAPNGQWDFTLDTQSAHTMTCGLM